MLAKSSSNGGKEVGCPDRTAAESFVLAQMGPHFFLLVA